jgi:hypothetical protein
MSIHERKPTRRFSASSVEAFGRSCTMKRTCATVAILLLSGGLAVAQGLGGYPPGVNPSNPQDLTNRSNPQDLTLPGAANPQDLVRSPVLPRAVSPALAPNLGTTTLLSPSLSHTYTLKPARKWARRKPRAAPGRPTAGNE